MDAAVGLVADASESEASLDAEAADRSLDVDAPPAFDRRKQRVTSDDPCEADGDCVATHFRDCCDRCEGSLAIPANAKRLAVRMNACKTKKCPQMSGTYTCAPAAPITQHAFCVDRRCVVQ